MPLLTRAAATTESAAASPQPISTLPSASVSSSSAATRSQWSKTFANGDSYSGEALHVHDKNQKPVKDGKGRYAWASSGAVYEGEWKLGRPHGHGVMTVPGKDGYEYTGDFVEGQRCGRGRCSFANGRTFDGEWKGDEMNGVGTVRGAPGVDDYEEYSGHFKVGKRSGPDGKCVYFNGDVYEGAWLAGKRQGMGEWQLHRQSSSLAVAPVRYKGPFDNDVPHTSGSAQAEVDYSDGSSYLGAVNAQLRRHGSGVHRLTSGDVFEGVFAQDQREGHGTLQGSDGMICEGTWHRGQLDGEVRVTFSSPQGVGARASTGTRALGAAHDVTSDVRNLYQLCRGPYPLKSYEGPCTAGVLTGGSASILYVDGSSYCGAVRNGLPHGAGVLRDRPFPYNADDDHADSKERPRRRISVACIPPAVSMTLVSYDGTFAAGEPDGTGTAEWQVSTAAAAVSGSPTAVRATPFNFSELLAKGVQWWKTSVYAVVDGTYTGQWLRGLPHGQGAWQWADGSSYTGEVAFYLPSGQGTYSSSLVQYTGEFKDGQPHGKGAWEDTSQNISYDGEWSAGKPDEKGVCSAMVESGNSTSGGAVRPPTSTSASVTSPCATVYEGAWKNGKPSGQGRTYASADRQRVVYDGHYVDGCCEGEGTLYFGSVRRGSINMEAATVAVHAYAQYRGVFHNGQPGGGPGCLTLKNSTTVEGAFDADLRPSREATITVQPHSEAWTFTGTFDATTRRGHGTMKFPNGDVYTGEVEDASADVPSGQQHQQSPQQPILYNLQRHGQGVYAFVEGNQLRCTWRHNVLHGAGVYTSADGVKTERTYADGVLVNDIVGSTVGASGGLSSVGTGGPFGNVFTPENEFPNTLSEEALKSCLPDLPPQSQPQQQPQQRKRTPFQFVRRGEARQASTAGAAAATTTPPPSLSSRRSAAAAADGGGTNTSKSRERSPPAPSLSSESAGPQRQPQGAMPRRGSSPPTSSSAVNSGGVGGGTPSTSNRRASDAATRDSNARSPTRGTASTAAAAVGHKYSLRRRPVSTSRKSPGGSSPSSSSVAAGSEQADAKAQNNSASKRAPSPSSKSMYVNRFQAGICHLDNEPPRSPSPSSSRSGVASSTVDSAAKGTSLSVNTPAPKGGPLRRRLGSALAAGRDQQEQFPSRRKPAPGSLHGSLKEMMKTACTIRNSREDEIHLLTEEMRQLNERIWQLRFVIANDAGSGGGGGGQAATAAAPSTRSPPSPVRRSSKNGAGVKGWDTESPASRTQRLAALVQERRVIMEKLQYVVNTPE
ncbi:hypothetical protein ABB37_04755 [Leptomonas pyrrhocoris]|uniref:Uncharacterized protein n=1 Tax=Leptomonas pyrrhocoris TaxID=157538 RepID=A0A0M9G201_LEPPY|nr:hypothetical protein ABB37_04755 [Leptomonas pyrrhocoris]KPA80549.1 hypothetical protein ABB37_04755 [Leptomonas pyrrhocoris]|eukprot:XP_015658988.1 hypothetical protein ABB37_04755 [Leptomonas pyrrhocoris]